jgi:SAM-dependent methyltransferase
MIGGNTVKKMLPAKLRRVLSNLRRLSSDHERLDRVERRLLDIELQQQLTYLEQWDRSRRRWRQARPVAGLTWGIEISGDAFVRMANSFGAFGPEKAVLEIGPGYGRLPKSLLKHAAFNNYLGVDLSAENVEYLKRTFPADRFEFRVGEVEHLQLDRKYDALISSLVFKHLFPTFEKGLDNVARYLNPQAVVCFDVYEGAGAQFESGGVTYIRQYTRPEVTEILTRTGLKLVAYDEVNHDEDHSRLFVVARK